MLAIGFELLYSAQQPWARIKGFGKWNSAPTWPLCLAVVDCM
jgi:hypothetical protein